jgi:hypothetical protein
MKRLAVCLLTGLLAACGEGAMFPLRQQAEPEPAPVAATEPVAAPAIELTQSAADDACRLYIKALYTGSEVPASETCIAAIDGKAVSLSTSHGRSLQVSEAVAGEVFTPTAAVLWHRAKLDEAKGAWENAGALFVTKSAEPLCMDIAAFAADGTSDSLFVLRASDQEPEMVPIPIDPEAEISVSVMEPLAPGGKAAAFAVFAREPRTLIKSISFRACP